MIKSILDRIQSWRQKSKQAAIQKKQNLLNYVDQQLLDAATTIQQHHNNYAEIKRHLDGYQIRDVDGDTLETEWSHTDYVTRDEIKATEGYKELKRQARMVGIKLKLKEEESEVYDDEERIIYFLDISKNKKDN